MARSTPTGWLVVDVSDTTAGLHAPTDFCDVPSIPWSHDLNTLAHD